MTLPRENFKFKIINFKLRKGFTLIELLLVISIIGILAAISFASFTQAQTKARDSKRKSDLKAIQQALEQYYQANNIYPNTNGGKIQCNTTSPVPDVNTINWGSIFQCAGLIYLNPLPKDPAFDPSTTIDYYYTPLPGNQKYMISATIENKNDSENKANPSYITGSLPCDNPTYNGPTSGRTYCVINP